MVERSYVDDGYVMGQARGEGLLVGDTDNRLGKRMFFCKLDVVEGLGECVCGEVGGYLDPSGKIENLGQNRICVCFI